MSFTNFLYTGLLALGIFSFDAWYHGGEINLEINIPKGYGASESSITDAIAENLFLNEIADIDAISTFVVKPRVRSTNEPTVVSMIGEMFGLKRMTLLIQRATGMEPLVINGSVTKRADRYQLLLVSNPEAGLDQRLNQTIETAPGEPLPQMIQRAAPQAMMEYQDYLVCLYLTSKAIDGKLRIYEPMFERPGTEGLDLLIQKRMQIIPGELDEMKSGDDGTLRRAMFTNLRGMLALAQGNDKLALGFFQDAYRLDRHFAIAALNAAFIEIHQDQYQEALDTVRELIDSGMLANDPTLLDAAYTTWGVAAWGLNRFDEATTQFRNAILANAHTTLGYLYWGNMLNEYHRPDESAAKHRLAAGNSRYFSPYTETAILFFRLTPHDSNPLAHL